MCNKSYENCERSIPFGVAIEQFRAGGDKCLKPVRNILMISC